MSIVEHPSRGSSTRLLSIYLLSHVKTKVFSNRIFGVFHTSYKHLWLANAYKIKNIKLACCLMPM